MQLIAYNMPQLDTIVKDIYVQFAAHKALAVSYDKPRRDKSKDQLGYFFGALVKNIQVFFKSKGLDYSAENIKENFYQAVPHLNDRLYKQVQRFNGEPYQTPKRLSEMTLEEANLFIDACLYLIDHSVVFQGLVLHPSIRYTWVKHIRPEDIKHVQSVLLPRQDKAYLSHTRGQACLWCGKANESEAHHLKVPGLSGMAYKTDDWCCVPLCHTCHAGRLHQNGADRFLKDLEWITQYLDLTDFCRIRYLKWKNKE